MDNWEVNCVDKAEDEDAQAASFRFEELSHNSIGVELVNCPNLEEASNIHSFLSLAVLTGGHLDEQVLWKLSITDPKQWDHIFVLMKDTFQTHINIK